MRQHPRRHRADRLGRPDPHRPPARRGPGHRQYRVSAQGQMAHRSRRVRRRLQLSRCTAGGATRETSPWRDRCLLRQRRRGSPGGRDQRALRTPARRSCAWVPHRSLSREPDDGGGTEQNRVQDYAHPTDGGRTW